MTHTQFKQHASQIGITFAIRMAYSEGVNHAMVQLWTLQFKRTNNLPLTA